MTSLHILILISGHCSTSWILAESERMPRAWEQANLNLKSCNLDMQSTLSQKNGGSQRCVLVAKCRDVYPIWFILRPNDCLVPVTPVNFKRTSQLQVCLAQLAKAASAKIKMFWPSLMVLGSFVKSVTSAPENATFERWSLAFCTDTRKALI